MAENGSDSGEPEYFAEYSLWNDSAYSTFSIHPMNRIEFTCPVGGSIFLSPPSFDLEDRSSDEVEEEGTVEPCVRNSPGFERYMRRALKVVTREDLQRDPALFRKDPDFDSSSDDSESSSDRVRDEEIYLRPPRPRWRTAQQVNGRGRRMNLMQRRLEQALSQPVRTERGASMMHRMGWNGGALGRESVHTDPNTPDPYYVRMLNAAYHNSYMQPSANVDVGFGLAQDSAADSPESGAEGPHRSPKKRHHKSKKARVDEFKINVLQYIREFVKNDLQVELFFEAKLWGNERKRIHEIVAKLMGAENDMTFDKMEMEYLVRDIERRNAYRLGTQSEGEAPHRQMCIYKEAGPRMFLVTPDDVRAPLAEETNPFLQSIARHQAAPPPARAPPHPHEYCMLDRVIEFFIEFSEDNNYTEFRFLGPYNMDEIDVMSNFFGMICRLAQKRPYLDYPERLVRAFEKGVNYTADEDPNGFVSPCWDYPERLVAAFEQGIDYTTAEDANGFVSVKKIFNVEEEKNNEAEEEKGERD